MKYLLILMISCCLAVVISLYPWLGGLAVLGLLAFVPLRPRALTLLMTGLVLFALTAANLDFLSRQLLPPPLDLADLESGKHRSTPAPGTWLTGPLKILYGRGVICMLSRDRDKPPTSYSLFPVVSRRHPAFVETGDSSAPLPVWVVGESSWQKRQPVELTGLEVAEGFPELRGGLQRSGVRPLFVFRPNEIRTEATYPGTTIAFYAGCLLVALGGALLLGSLWRAPGDR